MIIITIIERDGKEHQFDSPSVRDTPRVFFSLLNAYDDNTIRFMAQTDNPTLNDYVELG